MSNVPNINRVVTIKELAQAVGDAVVDHKLATKISKGQTGTAVHTVRRIRMLLAIEAIMTHFALYPKVWEVAKTVSEDLKASKNSIDAAALDAIAYASSSLQMYAGITQLKPYTFIRGDNVLSGYSFVHEGVKTEFAVNSSEIATTEVTYSMMNIFKSTCERNLPDNASPQDVDEAVLKTLLLKRPGTNSDMFHIFK